MSEHPGFRKAKAGDITCAACRHSWAYFKGGKTRYRCCGPGFGHSSNYTVPWGNTCNDAQRRAAGVEVGG